MSKKPGKEAPSENGLGVLQPAIKDPVVKVLWGLLCLNIVLAVIFYRSSPNYSIVTLLNYCLYLALRYWARRGIQPLAESSPELDSAVLYLRPFDADLLRGLPVGMRFESDEVLLASAFNKIGPFVAVGNPREGLPSIGAERIYLEDHWQQFVIEAIIRARLVVIHIGETENLLWEVSYAKQALRPEKLLLLVPDGRKGYEAFRRQAQLIFPHPLPAYPPYWPITRFDFKGLIRFESDWTPHFLPFMWMYFRGSLNTGLRRAVEASLRPVCAGLGVPWRPPSINWLRVIVLLPLSLIALRLLGIPV